MNLVDRVPLRAENGDYHVVVETPRGSRVKLKYDEHLEGFLRSRALTLGVQFPYDFGFFPQTLADDGDPLDALLLAAEPTYPGVIVPARVIGALRVEQVRKGQKVKRNDRVVAVPIDEKRRADMNDVSELPARVRSELEEFFRASIVLTGKVIRYKDWAGAEETRQIVDAAARAYRTRGLAR